MFDTIWHMLCMLCMFFSPYLYRNANETTKPNITKLYKIQTICDFVYFVYFVLEETLENIKVVYDQGPRGTTSLAAASWHNRRNRHLPNARVIQVTFALSHFRTLHALYALYALWDICTGLYAQCPNVSPHPNTSNFTEVLAQSLTSPFDSTIFYLCLICLLFFSPGSTSRKMSHSYSLYFYVPSLCGLLSIFHAVCICQREQNPLSVILPITFSCWVLKFIAIEEVWDSGTKCRPICVWVCFEFLKSSPDDKEESDGKWRFHLQKESGNTAGRDR